MVMYNLPHTEMS